MFLHIKDDFSNQMYKRELVADFIKSMQNKRDGIIIIIRM